jgi:serine/threonine protein kinase
VTHNVRSDPGDLAPGDQVAGYQIQARIGRGGMAVVYRALDLRLGRTVALKVLAPELGADEGFRLRFIRESRAAAGVDHPHIVPVFEAGESAGVLFIAMRYVSGGDVRSLIEAEGRLSPGRAAAIASQVASALDAAHARGLVHRDVKPGNILLGQASNGLDHAYLSDFGLSKHSVTSSTLTSTGQFLGTLDYVSPEQIQGQPVDGRADQYALACTVVEMLTGAPPFRHDDTRALMWAQLEAAPPRLTERRPELPPQADQVIARAMAKSPGGRYATCREFAAALTAACSAAPGRAAPSGLAAPPGRAVQSKRAAPPAGWLSPGGHPEPAREQHPSQSPSQWPGDGWPTAPAAAPDGRRIAGGGGRAAGAGGGPNGLTAGPNGLAGPNALAGPNGPVPRAAPQREGELARNFLTPGTPDASRWPSQPPPSSSGLDGSDQGGWPPPSGPVSPGRGRRRRQTGTNVTIAICIAVFVLGIAGAVAYRLTHRVDRTTPPAAATTTITVQPKVSTAGPRAVVEDFYTDINARKYLAAWRLTPETGGTAGYLKFRDGFIGTAHDYVTVDSVSGNVVTVSLAAQQTDGSVKNYAGTYTVNNGIISNADIKPVG